ncbi:MAG TPA: menaquinone biosynthesis decarboxylase [Candidatus Dormibacteraeota bacterium]|nr:menaquinone biosynthesis decarboxylase [Candidatus Dormibacteraeota bacterium]
MAVGPLKTGTDAARVEAPRTVGAYLSAIEAIGELSRVSAEVDAELEITEIVDRVSKGRGRNRALLFQRVRGHRIPVAINLFGSERRMALALGATALDEVGARLAALVSPELPRGVRAIAERLRGAMEAARAMPRRLDRPPCQEVVLRGSDVRLGDLPLLRCWPQDGGRYITLPLVITRDPAGGARNVGMYRLQELDDRTVGMHWQIHKGGAEQMERATAPIPVCVAVGGEPALTYAASAPLPPGIDEMLFAGWLMRRRVRVARAVTCDLDVPAEAEIVLEGYVDPGERRVEGPFGDHTGYYSLADDYPVMHIEAITMRRDPVYCATVVGRPPMEDYWLGHATERIFLPLLRMVHPEVVDYHMPPEGVFHNCVIVSMRKRYPGHAAKVMFAVWSTMQLSTAKTVVVVDADIDPHDLSEVAFRALSNVDPRRDTVVVDGALDVLDHGGPGFARGSKIGIDATRKGRLDGYAREWPPDIVMDPRVVELVDRRWKEYGIPESGDAS